MNVQTTVQKTTRDLYLAAAFLALGAKYEGANRTDPKNMEFIFTPKVTKSDAIPKVPLQDLEKVESEWINETLVINATEYAAAIKRMKSLVHTR
jgi:hypothetical protein